MKSQANLLLHSEFGLAGIFDNVRDGLVLVRYPEREIVLFNKAASEMSGFPLEKTVGTALDQLFSDPRVHATALKCSKSEVGVWPGHDQETLRSWFKGKDGEGVDLHFCRVDPVALAGPLVLLVMRPSVEGELERAITQYSQRLMQRDRPTRPARHATGHRKAKARKEK